MWPPRYLLRTIEALSIPLRQLGGGCTSPSGRESGHTPCRRMARAVERFSARDRSPGGIASQPTRLGDQYKKTGCYGV